MTVSEQQEAALLLSKAPASPTIQARLLAILEAAEHQGLSAVVLSTEANTLESWLSTHIEVLGIGLSILGHQRKSRNN